MARPLAFDPQEKLHQAMMLFWQRGYEATSMQELVAELEINRFSLYNTFGDKQALFAKTVELYEEKVFGRLLLCLQGELTGLAALDFYFDSLAAGLKAQEGVKGCFLQNTLLEGGVKDQQVIDRIRAVFLRLREALEMAAARAKAEGYFSTVDTSAQMADYLLLQVQGLIALYGLRITEQADSAVKVLKQQLRSL
jgi:TetR/AcrR family transcriptional regulator, transcriptional repressor for nem operon